MIAKLVLFVSCVGFAAGFGFAPVTVRKMRIQKLSGVERRGTSSSIASRAMHMATSGQLSDRNVDKNLEIIFRNNKQWVSEQTRDDPDFFDRLKEGQAPKFLWIGTQKCKSFPQPRSGILQ